MLEIDKISLKKKYPTITLSWNMKLDIILSTIIVMFFTVSSYLNNTVFALLISVFMFKNIEIPLLLFPLITIIKESFIIIPGITIHKLVGVIFIISYAVRILLRKAKFVFNDIVIFFSIFIIIIIYNLLFSSMFSFSEIILSKNNLSEIVGRIFLIIFVIFLYQLLSQYSFEKMHNFLLKLAIIITLGLVILSLFAFFKSQSEIGYEKGLSFIRNYIKDSDPNDFGILLGSLFVFPFYIMLNAKKKIFKYIAFFSFIISIISIFYTMSKAGIFVAVFSIIIYYIFIGKGFKDMFKIIIIGILIILILGNFANLSNIVDRLTYKGNLREYTTNRIYLWEVALQAILEKPIFGYGGATHVHSYVLSKISGINLSVHNMYLQFLLEYGLIGLFLFLILIYRAFSIIKINRLLSNKIFLLPFISLIALLFGGISLTWAFKEIIWYFMALSFAVNDVVKREYIQ